MTLLVTFLKQLPIGEVREGQVFMNDAFVQALLAIRDAVFGTSAGAGGLPTRTWYQASDPGAAARENDIWHDTDDPERETYVRVSGAWQPIGDRTAFSPKVEYIDDNGRVIDWRGLPVNAAAGVAVFRSVGAPLSSSSSSSISVAAHTYSAPGQDVSMPSGTITGLSTDTNYAVFYDTVGAAYLATTSPATYYASPDRYIAVGNQRTQDGGGGFTPPPPPPPGGGTGMGGGDPLN